MTWAAVILTGYGVGLACGFVAGLLGKGVNNT